MIQCSYYVIMKALSRVLVCGRGRDVPAKSGPVPAFSNNRIALRWAHGQLVNFFIMTNILLMSSSEEEAMGRSSA